MTNAEDKELDAAEAQVLACLGLAAIEGTGADRTALEVSGQRYWKFKEDWTGAFERLAERGLIAGSDEGFAPIGVGLDLAEAYARERPDRYWYYYQWFYDAAAASEAHSELCRRAFGKDLGQEGQVDMAAIRALIDGLDLVPGMEVLDLGCGNGGIGCYLAKTEGVDLLGLDNSAPAISAAQLCAEGQAGARFRVEDLSTYAPAPASLDAAISLDGLYWVADLHAVLERVKRGLRQGGRIGVFVTAEREDGAPKEAIAPGKDATGAAMTAVGMRPECWDYTQDHIAFWTRIRDAARDLTPMFEAEGNGLISHSLLEEADEHIDGLRRGDLRRYLYIGHAGAR